MLLKNCKLETGFSTVNQRIIATETASYDIRIENEVCTAVAPQLRPLESETVIDVNQQLVLPALREMHIHIDKTYFGGPWKACRPLTKGILTRIEEETWLLPEQLPTSLERACQVIEQYIQQGHYHIRSHCNVDPSIGTKHIEITKEAFSRYEQYITHEIVAFPQHGLLRSQVEPLMREALRMGATHVGGVDPALVDRHVDHSIAKIFELATTFNKKIDVHLHARDTLGLYEFNKFVDYTEQAKMFGKVTLSHALALGSLEEAAIRDIAQKFIETGIDLTSTVPIGMTTMPIPTLVEQGVKISVAHDSLTDHWSPFGSGNTIEKLNTAAQRFKISDEYRLNRLWGLASNFVTPLDPNGQRVWPNVGDSADFLLFNAESTAHVIARQQPIQQLILKGQLVEAVQKGERE